MTPRSRAGRLGGSGIVAAILALQALAAPLRAQESLPDTLDLDRAIRIGLARSPALAQVQAQADATGWDQRAAWGALLPTASLSTSLSRSNFTRNTFLSPEGESQTLDEPLTSQNQNASQSFGVNWTVFDLRRYANVREQGATARATQRRLDDQRLAVVAEVQRQYIEALRRQRLLELTRRQIEDRELELEITRRRYEIAAVQRSDVLGAESQVLQARITLLNETSALETGLRALAVAMGLHPDEGPGTMLADIPDPPDAGTLAIEPLVAHALDVDPELLAYEADEAAASASLWGARSQFLPTISVGFSWSRSQNFGPDASFFQFDPGDTSRGLQVSASWTLFDGFSREQQNAQASSRRRQARESLRLRRLEIEREVRRFLQQIDQLSQTLDLLQRSLEISQERLEMTRQQYQRGTANYTDLQQAIGDVTQAESQIIQQQYDYLTAWVNLEEYVGDVG